MNNDNVWVVLHEDEVDGDKSLMAIYPTEEGAREGLRQHIKKSVELVDTFRMFIKRKHAIYKMDLDESEKRNRLKIITDEEYNWSAENDLTHRCLPDTNYDSYTIKQVELEKFYHRYEL